MGHFWRVGFCLQSTFKSTTVETTTGKTRSIMRGLLASECSLWFGVNGEPMTGILGTKYAPKSDAERVSSVHVVRWEDIAGINHTSELGAERAGYTWWVRGLGSSPWMRMQKDTDGLFVGLISKHTSVGKKIDYNNSDIFTHLQIKGCFLFK